MPLVSIIIINYDKNELTDKCLKSIYSKTYNIDFEIILVDNASPNDAPELLKDKYPGIKLIKSKKNLGFAGGNNLGIRHAKGDYILLLNNDTVLENNAIFHSHKFLLEKSDCAVVGAKIFNYSNDCIQHNCQRFPSVKYNLLELLRVQKFVSPRLAGKWLLGSFFSHDEVIYPDWVWGTFFMFRKEVLNLFEQHKLPETFFMYFEDMQWCKEIKKFGYHIGFTPHAIIRHHQEGSKGNKNKYMREHERLFMNLYYSWWQRQLISFTNYLLKKSQI